MVFLVRVRVNVKSLAQFGRQLQKGSLDNTCVRGETWCLRETPDVGYSVWDTKDRKEFEARFGPWRAYYDEVEVAEVISPKDAMIALLARRDR